MMMHAKDGVEKQTK